jgi:hypothetical protein
VLDEALGTDTSEKEAIIYLKLYKESHVRREPAIFRLNVELAEYNTDDMLAETSIIVVLKISKRSPLSIYATAAWYALG